MHLTRHVMYKRIFSALDLPLSGAILAISGMKYWQGSRNYTPPKKIISDDAHVTDADYPDVHICNLPYEENLFDYVLCDQVIEHVEGNIEKAISEIHRVLKPGGTAVIATVFINPIHYGPKDLWRFSPDALTYLCRDFSKIIQCESWGNRFVHALFFLYPRSRDWQVKDHWWNIASLFALYNDPQYPQQTWIIARK